MDRLFKRTTKLGGRKDEEENIVTKRHRQKGTSTDLSRNPIDVSPSEFYDRRFSDSGIQEAAADKRGVSFLRNGSLTLYEMAEKIIDGAIDVDAVDKDGRTPLHYTASNNGGNTSYIIHLLLEKGANIDAVDKDGRTPLHYTTSNNGANTLSTTRLLLKKGANVNVIDKDGCTPLHYIASNNGANTLHIIRLLLEKGANIDAIDKDGCTPLHYTTFNNGENTLHIIRLLLGKGANVNVIDKGGQTPLRYASQAGSESIIDLFINAGADVNALRKGGEVPPHVAFLEKCSYLQRLQNQPHVDRYYPKATTVFWWEVPSIIGVRHNREKALANLFNTITLTQEKDYVEANICQAYVQRRFGDWGLQTLSDILSALNTENHIYETDRIKIEALLYQIKITYDYDESLDQMKALLIWLCLSFREPELDNYDKIYQSQGRFRDNVFVLNPLKTVATAKNNMTCWHSFFENPVIAVEPDTVAIGNAPLSVSFELMLQLAAVEYPLTVDGGIVLMGYSSALVPIRIIDDKYVFWHLEVAQNDTQLMTTELVATKSPWLKSNYLYDLKRKALIGWCSEAAILLGTDKLETTITWSNARIKRTTWRWSGANLQLLAQSASPLQIGGQIGFSMSRTSNTLRFTPSKNYLKCLNNSSTEQIVLYDLADKRAWLVPLLSVFHHMLLVYWNALPKESRSAAIPLAVPNADGGSQSMRVLRENGDLVVQESGCDRSTIRDLIMGFSANLSRVSPTPPRASSIYGYEFMDIVMDSPMAELKRRKIERTGLGWTSLLSQVRCLFCSRVGDVIVGRRAIDLNSPCNRLPKNFDLMASTIHSIKALSRRSGYICQGSICRLSTEHVWTMAGDPFTKCEHEATSNSMCWYSTKFLQNISGNLETPTQDSPTVHQYPDGAIVFGRERRRLFNFIYNSNDISNVQTVTANIASGNEVPAGILP